MSKTLRGEALGEALGGLPGWGAIDEKALHKRWTFDDFAGALAFVNRVGALAESRNHHPDVTFGWGRVELLLTTHDSGGITARDLALAQAIDGLDRSA